MTTPVQQIIIIMMDGFGTDYYRQSDMPTLRKFEKEGTFKIVKSEMPSVTNVNNTSICTGTFSSVHGITGNSYFNLNTNTEEYMEDSSLVLAPTIFERAKRSGVHSILLSAKKKTVALLSRGTDLAMSPETASAEWIARLGKPPDIYSREVNYWLMEAALFSLKQYPDAGILYIHTTDYPMHTWAPEEKESREHLHKIDEYIAKLVAAAPGAMFLITADHTVKHKNLCIDLEKACARENVPVKIAISAERDKYLKHHRGFGGTSYVYLKQPSDRAVVRNTLEHIPGVDTVLTREEAAQAFHLMPARIGDLVVLADANTVFGELDTVSEQLPAGYRTHGSLYEAEVPMFIYNSRSTLPSSDHFQYNLDLASWLFSIK